MALETEDKVLDPATLTRGVTTLLDQPAHGRYLLAVDGEQVAGQIMWTHEWSDWRAGQFWWIQSVYVAPDWRRQGVFAALFKAVRDRARRDPHACGLRLYVERENDGARETYLALGATLTDYRLMEWTF